MMKDDVMNENIYILSLNYKNLKMIHVPDDKNMPMSSSTDIY